MSGPDKVLIIDDEAPLRASLRDFLEDEGFAVLEAGDGATGVAICLNEPVDLVLTDLRMPVLDGFGVIRQLSQAIPELPLVVVSGQGTLHDVIEAIRLGAWDYITKPVLKLEELSIVLQRVLEKSRLRAENLAYREQLKEQVRERTAQLEETARTYRIVADNTYGWEFWLSPEGAFIYTSPSCLRITGHTAQEFAADQTLLLRIIHPDDRPLFAAHRHDSQEHHRRGVLQFRIVLPDGTIRWIHHNCKAIYDEEGQFLGTRGSNRDITSLKAAEEAHLKSEQRLAAIFDFLPDATWAINANGVVIAWNKACRELTGIPAAEMVGTGEYRYAVPFYGSPRPMLIDFALNPSETLLAPYLGDYSNFTIEGGSITAESSRLLMTKGRYLWWKAARLYGSDGTVTGAIESVRDITELRLSKDAALASSRTKSAFLATMSHELRTPLNAIIGFTDLIRLRGCGEITASQEEYLGYVLDSSRHLLALINDILDLSKIEAGKMELHRTEVEFRELLDKSLVIIAERAVRQRIELRELISEQLPQRIRVDPLKLKQILFNLLSNAVKFTPAGGVVTLSAAAIDGADLQRPPHRQELTDGPYLLITVSDTGIGIKTEDLHRIFQPFEQSDNSRTRQHEGTGLGLSLTRMLAELHGGGVWAGPNQTGTGSTFYCALPLEAC